MPKMLLKNVYDMREKLNCGEYENYSDERTRAKNI